MDNKMLIAELGEKCKTLSEERMKILRGVAHSFKEQHGVYGTLEFAGLNPDGLMRDLDKALTNLILRGISQGVIDIDHDEATEVLYKFGEGLIDFDDLYFEIEALALEELNDAYLKETADDEEYDSIVRSILSHKVLERIDVDLDGDIGLLTIKNVKSPNEVATILNRLRHSGYFIDYVYVDNDEEDIEEDYHNMEEDTTIEIDYNPSDMSATVRGVKTTEDLIKVKDVLDDLEIPVNSIELID